MGEVVRGQISDRPWGLTFGQFGLRAVSGQLTVRAADGRQYCVAFANGQVVGATSPLAADAATRIAMTNGMLSSTQAPTIARQIAATPEIDEIALLASACRLDPPKVLLLRRKVLVQRAARTFSIEQGTFVLDDETTISVAPEADVDIRAVIYHGARMNLSEERLATELRGLGSHFTLNKNALEHADRFGLDALEWPILDALRERTTLAEIEARHRDLDPRNVQSVIYALVASRECAVEADFVAPRTSSKEPISVSFRPTRDMIPRPPSNNEANRTPRTSTLDNARPNRGSDPPLSVPRTLTPRPGSPSPYTDDRPVQRTRAPSPASPYTDDRPVKRASTAPPIEGRPLRAITIPPLGDRPSTSPPLGELPDPRVRTTPPLAQRTSTSPPLVDRPIQRASTAPPFTERPISRTTTLSPYTDDRPVSRTTTPSPYTDDRPVSRTTTPSPYTDDRPVSRTLTPSPTVPRTISDDKGTMPPSFADDPPTPRATATGSVNAASPLRGTNTQPTVIGTGSQDRLAPRTTTGSSPAEPRTRTPASTAQPRTITPSIARTTSGNPTVARTASSPSLARTISHNDFTREYSEGSDRARQALAEAAEAFKLGQVALRENQLDVALVHLASASTLNPHEFDYSAVLVFAQFVAATPAERTKSADKVRKMLNHALQKSVDPEQARFFLGQVEELLGHPKEALAYYKAVIKAVPEHPQAHALIQAIEEKAPEKTGFGLFRKK